MGATITLLHGWKDILSTEASLSSVQFFTEFPTSSRPTPFKGDLCAIGVESISQDGGQFKTIFRFRIFTPAKFNGTRSTEISARLCDCLIEKQLGMYMIEKVSCGNVSFDRETSRFTQQVLATVSPVPEDTSQLPTTPACIRMRFKDFSWDTLPDTFTIINERQVTENFTSNGKPIISEIGSTITRIKGQGVFSGSDAGKYFRSLMDIFKQSGTGFLELPSIPGITALFSKLECISIDDSQVKYSFEFIEV